MVASRSHSLSRDGGGGDGEAAPADYLIDHAVLATMGGDPGGADAGPALGPALDDLGLIRDGALAIGKGRILAAGPRDRVLSSFQAPEGWDAEGRLVLPGLVDAHTHPLWAGDRAGEFEWRLKGASYVEIMAAGGGIASTVRSTREATTEALLGGVLRRLDALHAQGITTIEAKSGYGLSLAEELRHLEVLAAAGERHPMTIVPTFLGAHAVPEEFHGRQGAYVDLVVDEMLPAVAARFPGIYCDVFCDEGAFTLEESRRILEAARRLGLRLKAHSDEFAHLGCTALAAALGAASADHLVAVSPPEMDALAAAGTVAVLLPATTLGLGSTRFAPARELIARGVAVALGTDLNPGTAPCTNPWLIVALGARYLRMSPAEVLVAFTRNAAHSCGLGQERGRLAAGYAADLVVVDSDDYRETSYAFGGSWARRVMAGGRWSEAKAS